MKKWKKFAALGLAVTMLGGCMPQKVKKTETQAAQSEQETKADAAKDTAAEGGESTAAQDEEGASVDTEITGPVEVTIWHQYSDQYEVWFQEKADEFHEKNPDITINLQYQPADQYEAKVMAAAKAEAMPSMVHSAAANMTSYINEGALVNLDNFIYDETVGYEKFDERINAGLNEMYVPWDNQRFAMPLFLGGNVFFYNKTMFDELGLKPPTTWSEIEPIAAAVSEKIGKPGFGFQIMVDGYLEVLTQAGGEAINLEDKTIAFDSDIAKEKIAWYKDLMDKKIARLVGDDKHFTTPFANGDVGCYVALSGNWGYLVNAVGDKFELGAAPLPQEGTKKFVSLSEPVFAIAKTNPQEELASWLFLKYLISPETNAECGSVFGALPASNEALEEPVFKEFMETNPVVQAVYAQRDSYGYMPTVAGWYEIRKSLDKALEEIFLGIQDADAALADAKKSAEGALSK